MAEVGLMYELLRSRFEKIKDETLEYMPLQNEAVNSVIAYAGDQLRRLSAGPRQSDWRSTQVDISDMEPHEVQAFLSTLPVQEEWVDLVWPSERVGVRMRYADFVRHYDELWFPSRDDLWVTGDSRNWLLELNHEEIVTFVTAKERASAP